MRIELFSAAGGGIRGTLLILTFIGLLACPGMAQDGLKAAVPDTPLQSATQATNSSAADIPSSQDQQKAVQAVDQIFKSEIARASTPAAKVTLAQKMFSVAATTTRDPAAKYVLLNQAKTLAAQGGDAKIALQVIDEMARSFKMNALEAKADVLAQNPVRLDATEWETLIAGAIEKDKYQIARAFANAALRDPNLARQFSDKLQEIQQIETASVAAKNAVVKMNTDLAAKTVVAKFFAFYKNDWGLALPVMQTCNDKNLAHLADLELPKPTETKTILELADGWWTVSTPLTGIAQKNVQAHATELYKRIVDKLDGLDKARVEKRIGSLVDHALEYLVGQWKFQDAKGFTITWSINPDGTITADREDGSGNWKLKDGKVKIRWNNGRWHEFQAPTGVERNIPVQNWSGVKASISKS
jgi:hypothetical protein